MTANSSWRSPFLDIQGVVEGEGALAGFPLHFGDMSGEQWALEGGNGIVDRSDMEIVAVSGADRQSWLTSITTQILTGMPAGESRELLILSPQGHIEHSAGVFDDGETTWLLVENGRAAPLIDWLKKMRFALRVNIVRRDDLSVLLTMGNSESPVCVSFTWDDPWPGLTPGGTEYFQGRHPGSTTKFHYHVIQKNKVHDALSQWIAGEPDERRVAGFLAYESVRIAAWRPCFIHEVDQRAIPAELDWLRTAVHTHKGCYRGQESVARILNLGQPPRRLVFLQLDGSRGDLPASGAPVLRGKRRVGTITSSGRHADMGPIALALIARHVPASEILLVDGDISAAQEVIVPVDGKSAISPQQRPGAELAGSPVGRKNAHNKSTLLGGDH